MLIKLVYGSQEMKHKVCRTETMFGFFIWAAQAEFYFIRKHVFFTVHKTMKVMDSDFML